MALCGREVMREDVFMASEDWDGIWDVSDVGAEPVQDSVPGPFVTRQIQGIDLLEPGQSGGLEELGALYSAVFEDWRDPEVEAPMSQPYPATYAILDGARVLHLPALLEGSGLAHQCLFKGQAREDLGEVSPWLVKLDPQARFTRNMFTASDTPWHLWRFEPGIFLRSRASLETLVSHFRKYTKIKDEADKTYFFRFWEPKWTATLLSRMTEAQVFAFLDGVDALIVPNAAGSAQVLSRV